MAIQPSVITTVVVVAVSAIGTALYLRFYSSGQKNKAPSLITLKNPTEKYFLKLIEKKEVSHDTFIFRFALTSENHVLGLPVGQHIFLAAKIDGKIVVRPYTPISSDDDKGFVDLMIKVYFRDTNPKFPDGGKMSQYLNQLKIGDGIDFRGPSGNIIYKGEGRFAFIWKNQVTKERTYKKISMIAGGTGITPLLQIISAIVKNPADNTKISLIFANQTINDILCKTELDLLAERHSDQLQIWYTVDRHSDNWPYSVGFVDDNMIKAHLFPPSNDNIVLMCGPPPMLSFACTPNLDKLAYDPGHRFSF